VVTPAPRAIWPRPPSPFLARQLDHIVTRRHEITTGVRLEIEAAETEI
jgi:hypothetical protein